MAKPSLSFAGFLYDDSGDAVNGATVNLYAKNGVSTSLADTTTNSSGYWSISHTPASGEAGEYDVQITSGASKRRFKFDDAIQLASVDAETLSLRGNEGAAAVYYMFADEGEDAGDRWKVNVADGGVMTFGNDINSQNTYVTHLTITPNSTVASSTVAIAGNVTVGNALTVTGTTTLNGNLVLGDAAADTLTVGATLQGASPLTFEGGTADGYETTFAITDPTADRTITFPNLSGTVQLSGNPITGTTIDASTDFTIGDTVITDGVVTDSTGLQLAANLDINGTVDISGDLTLSAGGDGALVFATAGENSIKIPDNQASALIIEEANNAYITFVTTNGSEAITVAKATTFSAGIANTGTIAAGTWNGTKIATGYIADDAITSALIADDAVVTAAIADNAITNALMADDAIDSAEIADGAVDLAHMSSQSVDEDNLYISNAGSNGEFLSKQSGNNGGLTWATPSTTATVATTVTITDNESTDEDNAIIFTAGGDVDGGNLGLESDGTLTYNPSTGKVTATGFVGTLTGNVTGNASGTAATVTSGTQASITTVANVVEVGALDAGSISSGFGAIDNGTSNIRTATFTAETAVVPDAASGATLGTTSLEWGHVYIGDDQKIYLGDGQDVSLEYDEDGTDQLRIAGNTIFENQVQLDKDLLLDPTPADTVWSGVTAKFTAGEDLEDGECVYLKAADTKMWKAVANAGGTGLVSADIMCVAMCVADVSADAVGTFLLQGFLRADTNFPTYTVGETLYLPEAETSGKNVPEGAIPDSDGDFVQVLGWAADANTVYFSPNFTMVEVA